MLCECGCGEITPVYKWTDKKEGAVKGQPCRFIRGHHARLQPTGKGAYRWNGGVMRHPDGRSLLHKPSHARAYEDGYVLKTVFLVESLLGNPLPPKAVIHHFDNNPGNDNHNNLVVCDNQGYHMILHRRQRAYDACGDANWRKCRYCKKYDDPKNLYISPRQKCRGNTIYHKSCRKECKEA